LFKRNERDKKQLPRKKTSAGHGGVSWWLFRPTSQIHKDRPTQTPEPSWWLLTPASPECAAPIRELSILENCFD